MADPVSPHNFGLEADLAELDRHLATYGPDLSRWPPSSAHRFQPLLADSADAQRMVDEARALEQLVSKAHEVDRAGLSPQRLRLLRESVMRAAAGGSPPGVATGAAVRADVPTLARAPNLTLARAPDSTISRAPEPAHGASTRRVARVLGWPAGAAMAASLVLGLAGGVSGLLDQFMPPDTPFAIEQAGRHLDPDAAELAFGGGPIDFDEEDTL